jgi:hypothetical protein
LINEYSITFGYSLTIHHLVTFSAGYNHLNEGLQKTILGLSPSQDKYPVLVYTGPVFRASYAYRIKPFFYFGADIGYKHLQYANHTFHDSKKDNGVWYTRDEKSNVLVAHGNIGFLLAISNTPIFFNPSVAIGGNLKFRHYTTYDVQSDTYGPVVNTGTFSKTQDDISFMMNLNVGIRIGK